MQTVNTGWRWSFDLPVADGVEKYIVQLRNETDLVCERLRPFRAEDKHEADVVWELDMMKELGVEQHNMCTCPPASWGNTVFICTSNGVDDYHTKVAAPQAPSFIALDKLTGKVLWTDNSPGANIHHGQWSGPAVGVLGGVPQVIFPGGDGWVYSFHAEQHADGKPKLLWKFDVNPKEVQLELGGRGTRNEVIAVPVIYDGRVYVSSGQDPEHGEGQGQLWCLDPTKRGDISRQLVVDIKDRNRVIPHRREKAIIPENGEILIDNPNSGVVWLYDRVPPARDQKGDSFLDQYHRSMSSVAIKDDLLVAADFSGLIHCLNAKTGKLLWQHDALAAIWGSPLIVGDRIFVPDEDGDVVVLPLMPFPVRRPQVPEANAFLELVPLAEINMPNSINCTPFVAQDVLYITTRDRIFAIAAEQPPKAKSAQ